MDKKNVEVLRKILYAVETGGQVYGRQNYAAFIGAGHNTPNEIAITIGAGQWYAVEAQRLLQEIQKDHPARFEKLDTQGIARALTSKNWASYAISPTSEKAKCIIAIISSAEGIKSQDKLMENQIKEYAESIARTYGTMPDTAMMECINIIHQGGASALKRILAKTQKPYTAERIYSALCTDPADKSNDNQVGDYTSRQIKVIEMIRKYAVDGGEKEASMSKIEKAVAQMEEWANDDSHGYDQIYRWGEKGDYDCSAAVIQAYQNAGVPVKTKGATYTGNMYEVFTACGFKDVTSSVNLSNGSGMQRGDVLLNHAKHTALYCGNGMEVEASINEKGTATGGKPGDQTGKEFLVRSYRNYPWDCVLRYQEAASGGTTASGDDKKMNTVAYVARMTKDTQCYLDAGTSSGKSKLFPTLKKDAVVDVMQYTKKDSAGKIWYFVRVPHPTEGFVFEFIPSGCFRQLK